MGVGSELPVIRPQLICIGQRHGSVTVLGSPQIDKGIENPSNELRFIHDGSKNVSVQFRIDRKTAAIHNRYTAGSDYRENIRAAVEVLRERWRDVPIALIAPIDSHPAWTGTSGTANEYRDCLLEVGQDTGAIAVDATSAWEEAIEMGASVDALFANSANHPSDAGHAIIADALARADLRVASR